MNWREDGRETVKILALSIGACVAYGIAQDSVTARLCVEYFTIGHPRVIASESPQLLALVWGVIATWWVGAILGVLVSIAARAGSPPKIDARQLVLPVALMMLAVGAAAIVAGWIGHHLASRGSMPMWLQVSNLTDEKKLWFTVDAWAHGAAYLAGFAGGLCLAVATWVRRRPVGRRLPEWMRVVLLCLAGAMAYGALQATAAVILAGLPRALIATGPVAASWIGLLYGVVMAVACRAGSRVPATWRDVVNLLGAVMALAAAAAIIAGAVFHGQELVLNRGSTHFEQRIEPRYAGPFAAQVAATWAALLSLPAVAILAWKRR